MNLLNRWLSFLTFIWIRGIEAVDDEYNVLHNDGSFEFGYNNPDSYHFADGNRNNVVKGEFGGRNPKTGAIDSTVYTAGPRGFRPRGRNVHRKYDLNQNGPLPIGSKDDPYFDPYEDPSYNFSFRTRTYNRDENANRAGDVSGRYSYLDDVGERHNVEFIAGKNTGFHVRTPFPDSNPRAYGPLYFNGRGKPIPRGRTSIQRGLDGSYRFVSAGPDQRRTEVSDATGHVRGSYTYLDDKGVQHSVHYIAGPETGYRVLKNVKGPHLPTVFGPGIIPSDFYDLVGKDKDVFDTAASGHVNPINNNVDNNLKPDKPDLPGFDAGIDVNKDDFNQFTNELGSTTPSSLGRPTNRPFGRPSRPGGAFNKPSYEDDSDDSDFDLFGDGGGSSTSRPSFDDGSYKTTTRPPITVSTAPSRPFDVPSSSGSSGFGDSSEDYGSRPRPSVTTTYPTTTITTTTTDDDFDAGPSLFGDDDFIAGRPGPGRPGERPFGGSGARPGGGGSGSFRPTRPGSAFGPRPGGGAFGSRPGGAFGSRPRPGGRPTVRPPKPSYDDFDSDTGVDGDDFGLFGSESNSRPPYPNKPVHFGITDAGSAGQDSKCPNCKGTIVTNLGDRTFTVPPGVSVRAHVQAIDLIPFSERVPSPSEQLRADTSLEREQLNEAQASSDVVSTISTPGNTTVNVSTTTLATTTKKSTST